GLLVERVDPRLDLGERQPWRRRRRGRKRDGAGERGESGDGNSERTRETSSRHGGGSPSSIDRLPGELTGSGGKIALRHVRGGFGTSPPSARWRSAVAVSSVSSTSGGAPSRTLMTQSSQAMSRISQWSQSMSMPRTLEPGSDRNRRRPSPAPAPDPRRVQRRA